MPEASTGTVDTALALAERLLPSRPDLAELQAREILVASPRDPRAVLLLGAARRRQGDAGDARAVLEPLSRIQPRSAHTHHELGLALASLGESDGAIAALRMAVGLKRDLPDAWRALGDQLVLAGDSDGADAAYGEHIRASVRDPDMMAAANALCAGRLDEVERVLRMHLDAHPTAVTAMRMLAEAATRQGQYAEAEQLLTRCLELAPSFAGARHNLAVVLYRQQKAAQAIAHIERLLAEAPADPSYRGLLAACLGLVGEYDRAIEIYERVLAEHPQQPRIWLSYGHALRTAGRRDGAIAAYNRSLALTAGLGEAYWSLANLKTVRFSDGEVGAMEVQLDRQNLSVEDRLHLHFALGKAFEDIGQWARSFEHYAAGAALRRSQAPYNAKRTRDLVERSVGLYTRAFFEDRAEGGSADPAPIFVVGLPRSGSTLIEQILASHSSVEGTMELPDVVQIARGLSRGKEGGADYPESTAALTAAARARLGEDYLDRAATHRKLGLPFFVDKMPNNFNHIGLIRLILPRAKIIDARRHPMAACFSAFKQHFARGHAFSYDLTDLGRYYRDYVGLMAHFDEVLPGSVCRMIYEDMVENTEEEVRRLLSFCDLPFEPTCLRFWETERAVRTASSEQVRRPIFREGLDQWRSYADWLAPLEEALGPALRDWR